MHPGSPWTGPHGDSLKTASSTQSDGGGFRGLGCSAGNWGVGLPLINPSLT